MSSANELRGALIRICLIATTDGLYHPILNLHSEKATLCNLRNKTCTMIVFVVARKPPPVFPKFDTKGRLITKATHPCMFTPCGRRLILMPHEMVYYENPPQPETLNSLRRRLVYESNKQCSKYNFNISQQNFGSTKKRKV